MHTQEIIKISCHWIGEKEDLGSGVETCSLNIQAGLGTTALVNRNYAFASNMYIYYCQFRIFGFLVPFRKSQTLSPISPIAFPL